jgi:hypothetical protein
MSWNPLVFIPQSCRRDTLNLAEIREVALEARHLMTKYSVPYDPEPSPVLGREVGDDRVDISLNGTQLCMTLAVQSRVVMMTTSWNDTRVSRFTWDFCEQVSVIPTDPHTSYEYARKTGSFSNLGFNDSVVLRLILNVQKGVLDDHSSTPAGKMAMLGSRLRTPRAEVRGLWHIASAFQDALLATHRSPEPKYLPQQMGGTGVQPLFDNALNIFFYLRAYRGGKYTRIYATAVEELQQCLNSMESGIQRSPILCARLREKQEYFWGTYDNLVFVPERAPLRGVGPSQGPSPVYLATGGQNRYQAYENRLVRTRHIVPRSAAEREWDHSVRLNGIVDGTWSSISEMDEYTHHISRQRRAVYDGALSANTALQNLMRRNADPTDVKDLVMNRAFRMVTSGRREFTLRDADWVYNNGKTMNFSLEDISLSEDMFLRDEVSYEETFKVGGVVLRPYTHQGRKAYTTRTSVGLWQINKDQYAWSEDLADRLRTARDNVARPLTVHEIGPIFDADPEWVNDDSGLIARCLREHKDASSRMYSVIVVTADKRLCSQMAETTSVAVIRADPAETVQFAWSRGKSYLDLTLTELLSQVSVGLERPDSLYFDTGSLAAAAAKLDGDSIPGQLSTRTLVETGYRHDLKRFSVVNLSEAKYPMKIACRIHRRAVRPKPWRSGSRPVSSAYSDHSSWRRSSPSVTSSYASGV